MSGVESNEMPLRQRTLSVVVVYGENGVGKIDNPLTWFEGNSSLQLFGVAQHFRAQRIIVLDRFQRVCIYRASPGWAMIQ